MVAYSRGMLRAAWLVSGALALAACASTPLAPSPWSPRCRSPARELRQGWDPPTRDRIAAAMNEVPGEHAALRDALVEDLDALAGAWTDARGALCRAARADASTRSRRRAACQTLVRFAVEEITGRLSRPTDAAIDRASDVILATRHALAACDADPVAAGLPGPDADPEAARGLVRAAVALGFGDAAAATRAIPPSGTCPSEHAPESICHEPAATALLRGWSELGLGRRDPALRDAEAVLRVDPRGPLGAAALELRAAASQDPRPDLERALAVWTSLLGAGHPALHRLHAQLAALARAAGDDASARAHLEGAARALRGDPDSDAFHTVQLRLGDLERVAGELRPALARHRAALAHRERRRGPRHLDTAEALHAVGADLEAAHALDEAVHHYERAARIRQARAPDDPATARTYNNLGRLCYLRGDLDDARRFHVAALNIRLAALGEDHPDSATSYNNLGAVLLAEGDPDAALAHFTRARDIRLRVLGPQHPYLAVSLHNLGEVHAAAGRLDLAAEHYAQALQIRRARFGDDHPETARTRYALGVLALRRGDRQTAERELSAALQTFGRALGLEHPETLRALERLREARP